MTFTKHCKKKTARHNVPFCFIWTNIFPWHWGNLGNIMPIGIYVHRFENLKTYDQIWYARKHCISRNVDFWGPTTSLSGDWGLNAWFPLDFPLNPNTLMVGMMISPRTYTTSSTSSTSNTTTETKTTTTLTSSSSTSSSTRMGYDGIWRFPEIGVPPNHLFINGFSMK